jgi:hypothetical protein
MTAKYTYEGKVGLTVEIDHHIKRAFYDHCKKQEVEPSDAIQQHLEDLLARARVDVEEYKHGD